MVMTLDFKEAMKRCSDYNLRCENEDKWEEVISLYDKNRNRNEKKIPKIIHHIWVGGKLPQEYNELIQTFKDLNSDWEFMFWDDKAVEELDLHNKDLYRNVKNPGIKADIVRYEVLYRYGGIYFDVDFMCLKPLDDLLNFDLFAGIAYGKSPVLFNGLIGCTKGNDMMYSLMTKISKIDESTNRSVMESTGPFYFTRIFLGEYTDNSVALPIEYLYPYPNFRRDRALGDDYKKYLTDNSYCVHFWDMNWRVK